MGQLTKVDGRRTILPMMDCEEDMRYINADS